MNEKLIDKIKLFYSSAETIYEKGDYTSAATLYFKSLFIVLDYIIFQKLKITPKDHSERFKMLKEFFPEYYELLDKYYGLYRSTYTLIIPKEKCGEVRKIVKGIIEEQKIK